MDNWIKRWSKTEEDENQENQLKSGEQIQKKMEITREKWKSKKNEN